MNLTQIKRWFTERREASRELELTDFSITRSDFRRHFDMSLSSAAYWLEKAVKAGILKKALSRPANCYAWWIYALADCPVDPNDAHRSTKPIVAVKKVETLPSPRVGPKYRNPSCLSTCYVNSLSQYHFHVAFDEYRKDGAWRHRVLDYSFGLLYPMDFKAPAYLDRAIRTEILRALKTDGIRFYEHDRDGNQRFDDLRYHNQESVDWIISRLERG